VCVEKFSELFSQILVKFLDIKFTKYQSLEIKIFHEVRTDGLEKAYKWVRLKLWFFFHFSTADQQRTSKDKQLILWTCQLIKKNANNDAAFNMRLASLCLVFFSHMRNFNLNCMLFLIENLDYHKSWHYQVNQLLFRWRNGTSAFVEQDTVHLFLW
jgi:hypothetical protein